MHSVLRTVATFEYSHFAHLAKTKLESEGIECFIFDEHTSSMNWFYTNAIGGIKLKVRGEEYERALTILKETAEDINNIDDADEINKISCPRCSSDNIRDEKF